MVQMIAGHMMLRHFQFVMIFQALAFLLLHCNLCNVQKESVSMQRRRCRRMTLSSTTTTSIFKKLYDEQEEIVCINGKRKHFYFLLQIVFNAIISHHHISRLFESKSRLYYIHARNEQRRAVKRERKTETKSFLPLSFVTLNVICAIIVRTYIFLSSRMEYSWHLFFSSSSHVGFSEANLYIFPFWIPIEKWCSRKFPPVSVEHGLMQPIIVPAETTTTTTPPTPHQWWKRSHKKPNSNTNRLLYRKWEFTYTYYIQFMFVDIV